MLIKHRVGLGCVRCDGLHSEYEDLKIFEGIRYDDYKSICRVGGFLDDDDASVAEDTIFVSGAVMRQSFAFFTA